MQTRFLNAAAATWCAAAILTGCYASTANRVVALQSPLPSTSPSATPSPKPTPTGRPTPTPRPTPTGTGPTPTPSPTSTAQPQVVHIGFNLAENTDKQYGPVYFYSLIPGNKAHVVRVKAGSQLVFLNDGTPATQHTGSGLGTSWPSSFDNTSGMTRSGTTIDASLTWSTGTLNPGEMSQVFTVGSPGVYYFGCFFHYFQPPTVSNGSMGDIVVSM